jgi:hypothetical protein
MSSDAGWSSLVARRAHNPKVAGSNPAPAIRTSPPNGGFFRWRGAWGDAQRGASGVQSRKKSVVSLPQSTCCGPGGRGFKSRRSPSGSACKWPVFDDCVICRKARWGNIWGTNSRKACPRRHPAECAHAHHPKVVVSIRSDMRRSSANASFSGLSSCRVRDLEPASQQFLEIG